MLEKLKQDKITARKEGNKSLLSAIDFVLTDVETKQGRLKNATIEEKDIIKSSEKEADRYKEMLSYSVGTAEADTYEEIIEYLTSLVPAKLSEETIKTILEDNDIYHVEPKDIGKSMGRAKQLFKDEQVDMSIVARLVRG